MGPPEISRPVAGLDGSPLVRASGVEGLRCYFNGNGALPDETAMPGMELFAREVVPALRRIVPLKV